MGKVVRLTESDLTRIVKRVINEQGVKQNIFNACKGGDCSELFNYVMNLKGWDKKYTQINSNGVIYLQGKNSNGKRISISFPKQNSRNMDIMINGKQKSFPLFDILQSVIESPNNNELNNLLN
jgi:hypothetical protein